MRDKSVGFRLIDLIKKALWTLVWLAVWAAAAGAVDQELLLPGPAAALGALAQLAATGEFYLAVLWTAGRCAAAIILSVGLGVAFGWLASKFKWVREAMALPVAMFKAVPVMALAIYVILLVKSSMVGVVVCFFMCFPLVYANVLEGFSAVDKGLREVAEIYGISGIEGLRLLEMPTVMPYLRAAVGLVAGISWKAVVAAEVLSLPTHSLGGAMISAKHYLDTAQLFAYIFVIVVLSLCLEKLIKQRMGAAARGAKSYEGSRILRLRGDEIMRLAGLTVTERDPSATERGSSATERGSSATEQGSPAAKSRLSSSERDSFAGLRKSEVEVPEVMFTSVKKAFAGESILTDFNMKIDAGQRLSVCAPSGRGKTTIARILSGLDMADEGTVKVEPPCRVTYLFQEDRLFPWLNSFDNMLLGAMCFLREERDSKNTKSEAIKRILGLAADLEISEPETLWSLPEALSGGMAHRVALVRTFVEGRSLVILDEPFRGLDEELKERTLARIWQRETKGKTLMLITHQDKDAESLTDKILRL